MKIDMKTKAQLHTQVLSEKVGKQIINVDGINILELDREGIIEEFKAEGLLLFRGFEKNVETFLSIAYCQQKAYRPKLFALMMIQRLQMI